MHKVQPVTDNYYSDKTGVKLCLNLLLNVTFHVGDN